jgi:hypothetical protein
MSVHLADLSMHCVRVEAVVPATVVEDPVEKPRGEAIDWSSAPWLGHCAKYAGVRRLSKKTRHSSGLPPLGASCGLLAQGLELLAHVFG